MVPSLPQSFKRNVLVTWRYVFHLENTIKIKPSVMLRYRESVSLTYDINTSLLFKDKVWGGASVRSLNTIALMDN